MRDNEAEVERVRGLNLVLREVINLMDSHRGQIAFNDVDRKEEWYEIVDQLQSAEHRSTALLAEEVEDARRQKRRGDVDE